MDADEEETPPTPAGPPDPGSAEEFINATNAQPLAAPVSGTVPDETAWPPPVPAEAPGMVPVAPSELPPVPAAPPVPGAASKPTAEGTIRAEGKTAEQDAVVKQRQADKEAEEADRHARQAEADRIDALATRQEAQDRLNARIAEYDANKTLRDPRSSWSAVDTVRNKVAVMFGAMGAAYSGSDKNVVADQIAKRLADETDRQKFNIGQMQDSIVMARAGVRDADQARSMLIADEDAKHVSRINTIIAQGKAALDAQGVPKAQQATDARLVELQKAQQAALAKAHDDAVKNAEIEAHTKLYLHKAGAGGGGAGRGGSSAAQKLSAAIEEAQAAGQPMPQSQRIALANQLGVPLEAKAGQVSLKTIVAESDAANAKKLTTKDNDESTIVRDETGQPVGRVPTGRGGAQGFATRDSDYGRALKQLEALKADIAANGERVFGPEAAKRRAQLKENADIAVATVSPLGKTDEAMKKESASIGSSGAYTLTSASPDAIQRKIDELREQHERYRKETLIPLKKGEMERLDKNREAVPPAGKGAPPAAAHPAKAAAGETRTLNDGTVVRKIGPNNWQPVTE